MSAFVVEDKTINTVVCFLFTNQDFKDWFYRRFSIDLDQDYATNQLGKAMFELNVKAVEQRYGKGEAKKFRPLNYEFHLELNTNHIKAYKALETWLYQCCEGVIPETTLYKTMHKVCNRLAHYLVQNNEQYRQAPNYH